MQDIPHLTSPHLFPSSPLPLSSPCSLFPVPCSLFLKMDKNLVKQKLDTINRYIQLMQRFKTMTFHGYINDLDNQLTIERLLQLLIATSSKVNAYLVKELHGIQAQDSLDAFRLAGEYGILPQPLVDKFIKFLPIEHHLLFEYDEINYKRVYEAIFVAVNLYPFYLRDLTKYLDSLERKHQG